MARWLALAGCLAFAACGDDAPTAPSGEAVVERNNGPARAGVYVQPSLTRAAAARMALDPSFDGTVAGNVYAQPLYAADGPGGRGVFIVATESNNVVALDEKTGKPVWTRHLGPAPNDSGAGCGNIHPLGVTGTPYLDRATRTLYVDGAIGDKTITTHEVFALSLDDGGDRAGWPVDLASVKAGALAFSPPLQNQRGALALLGGTLYVPFGGHAGDCGAYHGWVIGIPTAQPGTPVAFATASGETGIWAPGGLASDGTSLYASTGNGITQTWQHQDAILRFAAGPAFSGKPADYWAPMNWPALDAGDNDLGGTTPLPIDVEGATPGKLLVAMGKDGWMHLVDRGALGGVAPPVATFHVVNGHIVNAAATVTTASGTFVYLVGWMGAPGTMCPGVNVIHDLNAVRVKPGAPPTLETAWCDKNLGFGSPMVTTTDGESEAVVWTFGAEQSNRLHGWDAETGAPIFTGGGPGDQMAGLRRYNTPIAVGGRIFAAADNRLYAFKPQ